MNNAYIGQDLYHYKYGLKYMSFEAATSFKAYLHFFFTLLSKSCRYFAHDDSVAIGLTVSGNMNWKDSSRKDSSIQTVTL